jgi:hypothetical protein
MGLAAALGLPQALRWMAPAVLASPVLVTADASVPDWGGRLRAAAQHFGAASENGLLWHAIFVCFALEPKHVNES